VTRRSTLAWWIVLGLPVAALLLWAAIDNSRLFFRTVLNGLTLSALYFLVASGFTLVFGLMRNVNLAHGALFLLGAYVGFSVQAATGSWLVALAAGFAATAIAGLLMQLIIFRHMEGATPMCSSRQAGSTGRSRSPASAAFRRFAWRCWSRPSSSASRCGCS